MTSKNCYKTAPFVKIVYTSTASKRLHHTSEGDGNQRGLELLYKMKELDYTAVRCVFISESKGTLPSGNHFLYQPLCFNYTLFNFLLFIQIYLRVASYIT